jgi:hypothetical protein
VPQAVILNINLVYIAMLILTEPNHIFHYVNHPGFSILNYHSTILRVRPLLLTNRGTPRSIIRVEKHLRHFYVLMIHRQVESWQTWAANALTFAHSRENVRVTDIGAAATVQCRSRPVLSVPRVCIGSVGGSIGGCGKQSKS